MIRIIVGDDTTMAHLPSGQVKFLSFWEVIKLIWWAVKSGQEIVIEDKL